MFISGVGPVVVPGGCPVPVGVDGEFAEKLAGGGVDDADLGAWTSRRTWVRAWFGLRRCGACGRRVAGCEGADTVDLVGAHAVVGLAAAAMARSGFGACVVGRGRVAATGHPAQVGTEVRR